MNRLSELQTIVRVANICNKNGLIKEADQLLNIFTKLAQENLEAEDMPKTEPVKTEPVKEPVKTEPVKTEPVKTEPVKTEVDSELQIKLDDLIKSSDEIFNEIENKKTFKEMKQLLPELTRIVDLARVIFDNPNLDEKNKKILSESLPELLNLQEVLDK